MRAITFYVRRPEAKQLMKKCKVIFPIFFALLPNQVQSQDLSSICITGGNRMEGNKIAPGDFGIEHNYALEATHEQILDEAPVDMDSYLQIVKDQAKSICDGDGECLASIDNYANHALNYALNDIQELDLEEDDNKRRLKDIFPENNFTDTGTQYFEQILSLVSLESEEQIINALEDLRFEIASFTDDTYLPDHEKVFVEGAISVAQASTSYWHEAYKDENNKFRHLARSTSVFDCLLSGATPVRKDNDNKHLRERRNKRRKLRGRSMSSVQPDISPSLTLQNNEKIRKRRNLLPWRYHYHSKKKSKYHYVPKYQVEVYKHYEYRSPDYKDDDDWYKNSHAHSNDYVDDWYYYYYGHRYSKSSKSGSRSADYSIEIISPAERLGRFVANAAFVIRADIIGVFVGAVIGSGCVVPSVASSFLFSATYAICYRRGL